MINKQSILLIILGLLVAGVLIPDSPIYREIPERDSGVFLYFGEQILNGKIPYRDMWDHKPPAIYYIDAIGLFIGNGSLWGVWLLEFISLYSASVLGFLLLKRAFGIIPAIFGSIGLLVSLVLLPGGNLAEQFALPFQFGALYLFWKSEEHDNYSWRGFLVGIVSAILFLLKPNLIGISLSIIIYLIFYRRNNLLKNITTIILGAVSIIFVVVIYFSANNALSSLMDSVFRYNSIYSMTVSENRILSITDGLKLLSKSGISIIVLISWIAGIFYEDFNKHLKLSENSKHLINLSLIGLSIEFVLSAISGRLYSQYYIAWLPVFTILIGFFAYINLSVMSRFEVSIRARKINPGNIFLLALLLGMIFPIVGVLHEQIKPVDRNDIVGYQAKEYILNTTNKSDYVLMWGAETRINFITHRQSPTRYVYQYPLYTNSYQKPEMFKEFLTDIKVNKPILIIDASPSNLDQVPRLDMIIYDIYDIAPQMIDVAKYVLSNYEFVGTIGKEKWLIYRYKNNDNSKS